MFDQDFIVLFWIPVIALAVAGIGRVLGMFGASRDEKLIEEIRNNPREFHSNLDKLLEYTQSRRRWAIVSAIVFLLTTFVSLANL